MKWTAYLISLAVLSCSISCQGKENMQGSKTNATGFATYFTVQSCLREGTSGITASGKPLAGLKLGCAMPTRPYKWGQSWRVTNMLNGKSVVVRQWDLGPGYRAKKRKVIIDLTQDAFILLSGKGTKPGRIPVRVEKLY